MASNNTGLGFRALRLASLAVATLVMAIACSGEEDSFPEVAPFPPTLEERLHAIRDQVAEVRGLPVSADVVEGMLTREVYRQYVEEELGKLDEDERRELEVFNIAFRLMHLIGPEDDLLEGVTQFQAEEVVGLYFPEKNRLVLIGEGATIDGGDELTLAHEYVHSFQDGHFDIQRFEDLLEEEEDGDSNTEYSTTIGCLKEGDATLSSFRYAEEVYGPDWVEVIYPADGEEATAEPEETIPPALERYFTFDYRECVRFVAYLYNEHGWQGVNEVYEDPPATTEQILHPDKYESREYSRNMGSRDLSEQLGQEWEQLDMVTFGEFDVYNYLLTIVDDEGAAAQAAAGWGSGWLSVYNKESGESAQAQDVVVHIALEWDSQADFWEFMFVYGAVVDIVSNGSWENEGEEGPVRWQGEGEYGYIAWDEERAQVDVIIASEEEAREAAATGL